MSFENWTIEDLFTRCMDCDDMTLEMDREEFAALRRKIAELLQAGNSPAIPGAEQRIADAVELLKQAAPAMLADNGGPDGPLAGRMKSPAIPGWIPVSQRMPGSQEWVIVFAKWANQQVLCWDDMQNRWTDFEDQSYYADMFSHWMPLPAAPQEFK